MNTQSISTPSWQETLSSLFARYYRLGQGRRSQLAAAVGEDLAQRTLALSQYAITHIHQVSEDKANRWLGFVQGVLIAGGLTDIETERDYTRPIFHALKGVSATHEA